MYRGNAPAPVESEYPTSGLTATSEYNERAGLRYGTVEAGFIRFGRDPNGQAWLVVDLPRRGSTSGRSVHLTREMARQMRDTLDALLKRKRSWGQP
jgi:hypothetical protein